MAYELEDMSDDELERIAYGGARSKETPSNMADMSDEELELVAYGPQARQSEAPVEQQQEPVDEDINAPAEGAEDAGGDYGFFDRRNDEITAASGRDTYTGQALVEGLTPFQRAIREGGEREENKNLSAFLDASSLRDAIERHGDAPDETLKGYKAKERGALETGVDEFGHNLSRQAANLPLFIGEAVKGVRGLGRRIYNNKATDVLIDYARDAGLSDDEIEKAKEVSQGDPYKMYDAFQEMALATLEHQVETRENAAQRLAAAPKEGIVGKIGGGTLGMVPMMEEFALGGAVAKGVGAGKAAYDTTTWGGRLLNGLRHSAYMTPIMGTEMARQRYGRLTEDEYQHDENGDLVRIEGDSTGTALAKAAAGGYGEAALFSLPIGEALMGWAPKLISNTLKAKVSPTVAKFYENYVKYGQITGLRGQPVMLGLMNANTFKDEVLGAAKKDKDYEGFAAEWDKAWNGTTDENGNHTPGVFSLEGQLDIFVSTLGVMAVQGGTALVKARRAIVNERRSTDSVLKTYLGAPDEVLRQMAPEQKQIWRNFITLLGKSDKAQDVTARIQKFAEGMGKKFGAEAAAIHEQLAKAAIEGDNTANWMQGVNANEPTMSLFSVPRITGEDGQAHVAWEDGDIVVPQKGKPMVRKGQFFIDPVTKIKVSKYLPTDVKGSDEKYIYMIEDGQGRRAFRQGIKDAYTAARQMEHAGRNEARIRTEQRNNKRSNLESLYKKYGIADKPIVYDTLEDYNRERIAQGQKPAPRGVNAETLKNGRQVYILDEFSTPQELHKSVLHEVGRHRGLDIVFDTPEKRMQFVAGLARSDDPVVKNQLNRIIASRMASGEIESPKDIFARGKNGEYLHSAALEEVYAHLFDHDGVPLEQSAWTKRANSLRRQLRKVFHGLPYTRAEAEEVYRGAMEKLKSEHPASGMDYYPENAEDRAERAGIWESPEAAQKRERGRVEQNAINKIFSKEKGSARGEAIAWARKELPDLWKAALDEAGGDVVKAQDGFTDKVAEWYMSNEQQTERDNTLRDELVRRFGEEDDAEARAERRKGDFKAAEEDLAGQIGKGREIAGKRNEAKERERIDHMRKIAKENERRDHERRLKEAEEADDLAAYRAEVELWEKANREAEAKREAEVEEEAARREEESWAGARKKAEEDAEAEREAAERARIAQEREEERRVNYTARDENARQDRLKSLTDAFHRDDSIRGGEERKRRQREMAEYEARERERIEREKRLENITVGTSKPEVNEDNPIPRDGDRYVTNHNGHKVEALAHRDAQGNLIGWDVREILGENGEGVLIASTTRRKKDGEAAIRALQRNLDEYFGGGQRKEGKISEDVQKNRTSSPQAEEVDTSDELPRTREINGGRNRQTANDTLDIANSIAWGGEEGGTARQTQAPRSDNEGFDSLSSALDWLSNLSPDAKFFNRNEELMDASRAENNRQMMNMIAAAYDQRRIRGFGDFAAMLRERNPAFYEKNKAQLPSLWNYAASMMNADGRELPRVGKYTARDALRSAESERNVRDVSSLTALQGALMDVDTETYPAKEIGRGDGRYGNFKLDADPKTGIVPENALKGRPRSLLSKPIIGIEYADGKREVVTGRHRAELYSRYDMDIPVRWLKETDGWVKKREDGTYDTTKLRLIDALDNIQDGKGSTRDYVAFFEDLAKSGDFNLTREEAESEGFLSTKEARAAYAIANYATDLVKNAINYESGRRQGMVSAEQAGAIAEAAPKGRWEHNDLVQEAVLKDVLADRGMTAEEIGYDANSVRQDIRQELESNKVQQMDLFGNIIDAGADTRKKKRDYIAAKVAEYETLARKLREAQRAKSDDILKKTISRDNLRALGINDRKIARGGEERREEYEKAIRRTLMDAQRWRTGGETTLDPDLEARMYKDLGMELPKERQPKEIAYREWLDRTGNPDSDASRHLFEARDKKVDDLFNDLAKDISFDKTTSERSDADANTLFFNKNEELERKMGGLIDQLVRGKMVGDFSSLARLIHDKNKSIFENIAPALGRLWNERAKKLGVATIGEKEYNDIITKLGGQTNGDQTGLGGGLTTGNAATGVGGGGRHGGASPELPGGSIQQPQPQGEAGSVGTRDGTRKDISEGGRGHSDVAGTSGPIRGDETAGRDGGRNTVLATGTRPTVDDTLVKEPRYDVPKINVPGAKVSETPLVEPRGLRGSPSPDVTYKHHIPQNIIESGALQKHQMGDTIYAGQTHEQRNADGTRKAFLSMHGTGAGKTRIAGGIILDNMQQGRKKALYFSPSRNLRGDVVKNFDALGMKNAIYDIKDGTKLDHDGVAFGTYNDLKADGVVDNIVKSLGKDFDGVIVFDECHTGRTPPTFGQDGKIVEGRVQHAMVKLQEELPNARVLYMSATPGTEVHDLGYATRLGLWGEGTQFKDFKDFVQKMKAKNLAGMEAISRSLKLRGQALASRLSDEGVDYREVHTVTTPEQRSAYAAMNRATRNILEGVYDALEAMGDLRNLAPSSSLHGMQQRMHNSMMAAVKIPQIIEKAKEHLAAGESPVFSLYYTNEAGSGREVAKAVGRGETVEMDEVNFGPKQILLDFLTNETEKDRNDIVYKDTQFPTKTVKGIQNPVTGETEYVVVENDTARAIRARLIEQVKALPDTFGNPINMIIEAFGKDNVANLTGLNAKNFDKDYKAFQNGDKKVLVFSKKANTGFTFSADKTFKNQARRVFFKIQNEWNAGDFEQARGRVHRNNQSSAPIFYTTTSDFPGEARFFSTIARRKGQLSALSSGDRTVGGEMVGLDRNLEDDYSRAAVQATIQTILNSGHGDEFARMMNFIARTEGGGEVNKLHDKNGNAVKMPPGRFWNRVMLLDPQAQDKVFEIFDKWRKRFVQDAIDDGVYDAGLQDSGAIRAEDIHSLKLDNSMSVEHVNNYFKNNKLTFDNFRQKHPEDDIRFVRSKRTGEVFAVEPDGKMKRGAMGRVDAIKRYSVDGRQERMYASRVETRNPHSYYEELTLDQAKGLWDAEYGIIPDERAEDAFYANGDLLKHWNSIADSSVPRTYDVKTANREFTGAGINTARIPEILRSYGKGEEAHGIIVDSVVRKILNNKTVELAGDGNLKMKGVPRDGKQAVMVSGFADKEAAKKWALDVKMRFLKDKLPEPEATADKKRVFFKADAKILKDLIDRYPVKLYDESENPIGDTSGRNLSAGRSPAHQLLKEFLEGSRATQQERGALGEASIGSDASQLLSLARKKSLYLGGVEEARKRLSAQPFNDGEIDKHGMETLHVMRDGDKVVKFRRANNSTDHEYDKVNTFNEVFDRTPYTIRGFAEDKDGRAVTVLEQPYIDLMPKSGKLAREQLVKELKKRFGSAELRGLEIHAGPWAIDDLKDANIGIDSKTGKPAVVDAIIHRVKDLPERLRWETDRFFNKDEEVSDRERDAAYMDAVERGDMETAQRMVREAAARAMPNTKVVDDNGDPLRAYHATDNDFTVFDKRRLGEFTDKNAVDDAAKQLARLGFWFNEKDLHKQIWAKKAVDAYLNITNPYKTSLDELWGELREQKAESFVLDLKARGHDGIVLDDLEFGGKSFVAFEPNQIKSADPVTYDDAGNVIPLSQRFNRENPDIRYFNKDEELEQKHTSAGTSLPENRPALFNDGKSWKDKNGKVRGKASPLYTYIREGGENLDIGAGKTREPTKILERHGVKNYSFDPFNRSQENNAEIIRAIREGKQFDTVTAANLLNVLESPELRENVILQTAKAVKPDGHVLFDVYRAPREGEVKGRRDSWQTAMKTRDYLPEVRKHFDDVRVSGDIVIASKPKEESLKSKATWWDANPRERGNTSRFFNIDEEAGRRVHIKKREDAEALEAKGIDRRKIWLETGWWKAKDGKWRVEIPGITEAETKKMLDFALKSGKFYDKSKDAKLNQYAFTFNDLERIMKEKGEKLPSSVKTLLAAYPEIGKHRIVVDRVADQPKDGTLGYASNKEIHLYERGTTAETLNHELQHRIQAAAGMARGTNTNGKSFDRYAHEHGEWEARQASARAKMTPEERAKTAPWETPDEHGVAEDATLIDANNQKKIRPDGAEKPPRVINAATDEKPDLASRYHTNFTDRFHPLLEVERLKGRGKNEIYREDSPYNAQRLKYGHNEAARKRYEDIWKRPFEKMLKKSGVTVDDVGLWMMATDAKDRNKMILERNGRLEGSGMSDEDAAKFLAEMTQRLGPAKIKAIEEMANHLWKMQDEGIDRRVESGRLDGKVVDEWRKREPHHVPMRDDLEADGELNRSTRQWRRDEFRTAEGRQSLADNPVEFMFKEYQEAMYGSNENDARKVFAKFIQANPDLGVIRKGVRKGKGWSFTHNQIEQFPDPYYHEKTSKDDKGKPNLVAFKDGGNLYMIELDGKLGERLATAIIGRDVANAWELPRKLMRGYASTATELSPMFGGRNFVADMLESSLNTIADKGLLKGGVASIKHIADALAMTKTIFDYNRTGKFTGKYANVMREYVESGASIGGAGNEGYVDLERRFEKVRLGKVTPFDVLKLMARGLSIYNKQMELATRLAVFKDYRDNGASLGEAAMRSREYTTDFNKFGNQRWMNSYWMFSGSVIGSAVRQMESLGRGKAGKELMLGLFTYGVAEAMMEHFSNVSDDEKNRELGKGTGETMPEFHRANSLYFRMGDKFVRVPFHAGPFSLLKYAGNVAARVMLGDISAKDATAALGKEMTSIGVHFTGTGDVNWETINQHIYPTILTPFVQAQSNTDFAGHEIRKRMYSDTKPYAENGRRQTGEIWKAIASGLNSATGGNEKRRGWFDFSPEIYKHWFDSVGKNLTSDISTVVDFVTDLTNEDEVDLKHRPYSKDYYKDIPDNTANFYAAEKAYKADLADNTIRSGSPKAKAINDLLKQINNLRHWEMGERKVGSKWVPGKTPSAETKEKYHAMRLKTQQRVIKLMQKK